MTWEDDVIVAIQAVVRESHRNGVWDALRAILDAADQEPGHECQALEFARRIFRDPISFDQFIRDSQSGREAQ